MASVDRKKIDSLGKQHEERTLSKITAESIISTESLTQGVLPQEIKGTLEELAENLLKTLGLRFKDEFNVAAGYAKITLKAGGPALFYSVFYFVKRRAV